MMKTYSIGGIHPSDSKISKDCKIEILPVPSKVYISVAQHLGAPATPIVKAGDTVKAGQIIADGPATSNGEIYTEHLVHADPDMPSTWLRIAGQHF